MDIASPMKPNVTTQVDYNKLRHQAEQDDLKLSAAGLAWLASVEQSARPIKLAAAFPRIVNRMAKLWKMPGVANRYLAGLLTGTRGNRRAAALNALTALWALKGC